MDCVSFQAPDCSRYSISYCSLNLLTAEGTASNLHLESDGEVQMGQAWQASTLWQPSECGLSSPDSPDSAAPLELNAEITCAAAGSAVQRLLVKDSIHVKVAKR